MRDFRRIELGRGLYDRFRRAFSRQMERSRSARLWSCDAVGMLIFRSNVARLCWLRGPASTDLLVAEFICCIVIKALSRVSADNGNVVVTEMESAA